MVLISLKNPLKLPYSVIILNTISRANKLSVERKLSLIIQKNIWLSFGMKYLRSAEFWSRRILSAAAFRLCDATTAGDQNRTMNGIVRGQFICKKRERERESVVIYEAFMEISIYVKL